MDRAYGGQTLGEIIYGARMGRQAVEMMRGKTSDPALIASLDRQAEQYRRIESEAEESQKAFGFEPEGENTDAKEGLWTGANAQTPFDDATERLEELVLEEHQVVKARPEANLHNYSDAGEGARASEDVPLGKSGKAGEMEDLP